MGRMRGVCCFLFCEGRKGAILMLLPWFFSKLFARIKKKE